MSQTKTNLMLLLVAFIWGTSFVAQKSAMDEIEPFSFICMRFFLSTLFVAPFAIQKFKKQQYQVFKENKYLIVLLCIAFFMAISLQQIGISKTTITNAGFLTSLYVILTPILAFLIFQKKTYPVVWIAAPFSVFGIWLLGDGSLSAFKYGDLFVIISSIFFALHTILVGVVVHRCKEPIAAAFIRSLSVFLLSLPLAFFLETISYEALISVLPEILYAGFISGGVAYSLQFIAQQHTPAADAAIILSGESLFAALAGVLLMNDQLSALSWLGCGVIFTSIMSVQIYPYYRSKKSKKELNLSI